MPGAFACLAPCVRSFRTHQGLSAHRTSTPECYLRYSNLIKSLSNDSRPTIGIEECDEEPDPPVMMDICADEVGDGCAVVGMEQEFTNEHDVDDVDGWEDVNAWDPVDALEEMEIDDGLPPLRGVHAEILQPMENADFDTDVYPNAGQVVGVGPVPMTEARESQETRGNGNMFYPFANEREWNVAAWLHQSGLPLTQIDKFLNLDYVGSRPLSFASGAALHDRIEQLPDGGPQWKCTQITPLSGTPSEDVMFLHRDPVEAIKELMATPALANDMEYTPRQVYTAGLEKTERVYSEMSTGDWWWRTQARASLPDGATVVPVIIGSDKTQLTQFAGDKSAWPVYLSIGNIRGRPRNSPPKRAWMLIGYIPIVHFTDLGPSVLHSTLKDRLFHQCLEQLFDPLIQPGINGMRMTDSFGNIRHCYPRVAACIADFPEQVLINAAGAKCSPTTTAGSKNLQDDRPHPPRTYEWIMSNIAKASQRHRPSNVLKYTKYAKTLGLNGVHRPFWRRLPGYQPELCLSPDLLHNAIRFWRDHLLHWVRLLVGKDEFDKRLKALQPVVGFRSYRSGIKSLAQWSGREDRELQRVLVAIIAGAPRVSSKVMQNVRAFHDFLYIIQYRSHNTATLDYLAEALDVWHATKNVYIQEGVRVGNDGSKGKKKKVIQHFNIPKVAGFHHYLAHIPEMGSSPQYSSEITEYNHQPLTKGAYRKTNHKNYYPQMCRYLDRRDRITRHFALIAYRAEEEKRIESEKTDALFQEVMARYSPSYRAKVMDLRESINAKEEKDTGISVRNRLNARIWVPERAHVPHVELDTLVHLYNLPSLQNSLKQYLRRTHPRQVAPNGLCLNHVDADNAMVDFVDAWYSLRIQLPSVQDDGELATPHRVEAIPPSAELPYGRCHCVLIDGGGEIAEVGVEGYRVAQVRLIFQLHMRHGFKGRVSEPLIYVQWFSRLAPTTEEDICMYEVSRVGIEGEPRGGEVLAMKAIARFVQLIPKYGSTVQAEVNYKTSMDVGRHFYVNSFADKEIYQAVY